MISGFRCCLSVCLQSGQFSEDMIPTVGFNMRKITKGNVTIKVRRSLSVEMKQITLQNKKLKSYEILMFYIHLPKLLRLTIIFQ